MDVNSPFFTIDEIRAIHDMPLLDLIRRASCTLQQHHRPSEIQVCHLISIKTGGCPEDCKYCAQSSRYSTAVKAEPFMTETEVLERAAKAIAHGVTRVCLGAAWRAVREGPQFEQVLGMISKLANMGVEVCCTLGMLTESNAKKLAQAGLYAYNHNLDSSPGFYQTIITTRSYEQRLKTLDIVSQSGLRVCCGGIIGMGESVEDRIELIHQLAKRSPPPESVPINILAPVKGTPLGNAPAISIWEVVRIIATARIVLPKTMIRLSAGRSERSLQEQALCFLAGANSIFAGDKLLTISNPSFETDDKMFELFGLTKRLTPKRSNASI